ncbi:hypothetical protein WICMUC_000790 [Wickerhamomyces mucosus]|uniref:Transmembrane protein n=1 Tax=Wickerhamomyces mucosus TaxID=1378264 RepID=A0A9P8PY24_9ASCO|nr:hypothetical protein WICMUC_000790 [Wickerhamomyces mucosus]
MSPKYALVDEVEVAMLLLFPSSIDNFLSIKSPADETVDEVSKSEFDNPKEDEDVEWICSNVWLAAVVAVVVVVVVDINQWRCSLNYQLEIEDGFENANYDIAVVDIVDIEIVGTLIVSMFDHFGAVDIVV